MLPLLATNAAGIVLFAVVYAAGGARVLSQAAFLACLVVLFALVTSLWVRVEARHRALEPLRRVGRAAAGLVLVAIVVPSLGLLPLFWLETKLPAEAGLTRLLGPAMTITLIALALVLLVNVVGGGVAVVRALVGRRR